MFQKNIYFLLRKETLFWLSWLGRIKRFDASRTKTSKAAIKNVSIHYKIGLKRGRQAADTDTLAEKKDFERRTGGSLSLMMTAICKFSSVTFHTYTLYFRK